MPRAFATLALFFLTATATAAAEKGWLEVRSPHFVVVSNGSERQAREVALKFEQIHSAFAHGFPQLRTDSGAETIVLAVRDESDMKALLPGEKKLGSVAGMFQRGWEKDYALIRLDFESERFTSIYHEYIHKLLELNYARLPIWLNEGLSEFFGTARFEQHQTILGAPSERVYLLRYKPAFPLDKLLAAKGDSPYYTREDNAPMLYAEVWGLTHFLMFGEGMGNGRRMNEFLRLLQTGSDDQKAFQQAFGDVRKVQDEFQKYVSHFAFYGLVFKPAPVDKSSFAVREMSPAESNAVLGGFYARNRDEDFAQRKLASALALDPKLPLAHENMAFLDFQLGKDEEARREFSLAAELNPKSYLALYYLAMLSDGGKTDSTSLDHLDNELQQVLQLNPRFAPAYVVRSHIYARQQKLAPAVSAALEARKLEPDRAGYHTNAAAILLLQHDYADAIKLASYVARRWYGPDSSEALELLAKARKLAGIQPTSEEQAQESKLMKYAEDTSTAEGMIEAVTCEKPGSSRNLRLLLVSDGKKQFFTAGKSFGVGWSDTVWFGSDHFDVCHRALGFPAVVRYKPSSDKSGENEMRWLEIRNPLNLESAVAH